MSNGSSPSGGRILALLTLFLALVGPPAALVTFSHSLHLPLWGTIVLALVYEIVAFFLSVLTEVWQKLKAPWIETIANRIDLAMRRTISHYHRHYRDYFIYEYRDLDVKGITTQGIYSLDLEDVFVELRIDPKAPYVASVDPLRVPIDYAHISTELRRGSHTIWECLAEPLLRDQPLVILGPPGSGKTTLLKHLGLAVIHHTLPRAAKSVRRRLPVLLFLREHSQSIVDIKEYTLADAIRDNVNRWKYPMPIGWIEHYLMQGQCLILLDGLDEIADATQRQYAVTWVERQMRNYGKNQFVLTSRPFGYQENPLAHVMILEVQPLTFSQATQFVRRWYQATEIKSAVRNDPGVRMKAEQGARDLLRRLHETPDLFGLAVNPLLLTMIATIHRYRGTLPGARIELYKEIFEVFLGKRQAARGLVQDLRAEQRQLVLQPLAYEMMRQGVRSLDAQQAEFFITDTLQQVSTTLTPHDFLKSIQNSSGLLLERERNVYSFAHKTFQEYLAAVHISKHGLLLVLSSHVSDEWWHETIRLYCALADASQLIMDCVNDASTESFILALECEQEALSVQAGAKQQLETMITQGMEGSDLERRRIIGEALLGQRLRQMNALNEHTFIDTTLITQVEYQIFLDELRLQGKYHQPDHWADGTYPTSQGQQPTLGMRRSDAQVFCMWLSKRSGGIWNYRLPNENDLNQADPNLWKCLSSDLGYWVDGEQRFVWAQGQPSLSLSRHIQTNLLHARNRARDLAFTFARDLGSLSDYDLIPYLVISLDRNLESVSARARDRALNNVIVHSIALAPKFGYDIPVDDNIILDIDRDIISDVPIFLDRDFNLVLSITSSLDYDHNLLFLLQERRKQKLPAWEGILLVKERVLDV